MPKVFKYFYFREILNSVERNFSTNLATPPTEILGFFSSLQSGPPENLSN